MSRDDASGAGGSRRRNRLIGYWALTVLFGVGMGFGGVADILRPPEVLETFAHLGYPAYFALMLGVAKVLGAAAVLAPGLGRVKEWAYAGFGFDLIAAMGSHLAVGDPVANLAAPVGFLALGVGSYVLRPASRRLDAPG